MERVSLEATTANCTATATTTIHFKYNKGLETEV